MLHNKRTSAENTLSLGHDASVKKYSKNRGSYYLNICYKLFKEPFTAREEDKTLSSSKAMHNNIFYNRVKHISRGAGNA
jgi:hypothetical protein